MSVRCESGLDAPPRPGMSPDVVNVYDGCPNTALFRVRPKGFATWLNVCTADAPDVPSREFDVELLEVSR